MEQQITFDFAQKIYNEHIDEEFDRWFQNISSVTPVPSILLIDQDLALRAYDEYSKRESKRKYDAILAKYNIKASGEYIDIPIQEAKMLATRAIDKAFNTHFISVYTENMGSDMLSVDSGLYRRAKQKYEARMKHEERLAETARLNNIGIACEKAGDIDGAIAAYEECAKLQYPAEHCYERLRILYKKRKDFENMERAISLRQSAYYDEWEEYCHATME